ncbi:VWA domain-containing protein [Tistrella mobilis]|uniref:vWA domain-containing protein n=1 Tax=Tistrella mobilis TaxID=171437 RepID=UPI0031F6C412
MRQLLLKTGGALLAALITCGTGTVAQAGEADRATILILDASGSMWGRLADDKTGPGGKTKIEVARDVLDGFLGSRDMSVPLGIIAYGHNRRGDCSDIEQIAPVGRHETRALSARLARLNPRGKTPLGQSLRRAAADIPRTAEEADIVLVTDGLETCDVDPCAVAAELAAEGIRIRAHVVGFGLTETEAAALACIPDKTGGLLMRPQSGAELAEALSRATAEAPPVATTGLRLIFSYPGAMPDTYEWALRDESTGQELVLGKVSGAARYQPFAVELAPGTYTAIVTAEAGRGEARFTATGAARDIVVTMQGLLPVTAMRDRGPYAARGETVAIDLNITQAGQETGGAALALRLYAPDGGEAITYSTVEGKAGVSQAGINLPATPGPYLLKLESWGGEPVEEMIIQTETDPAVTLLAPPAVAPGAAIPVGSTGSQLWNDGIEIWQGDRQVDWGVTLGDLANGNSLTAPAEPGTYDLVYRTTDAAGTRVEKARLPIMVGTVADDATGAAAATAPGAAATCDDGRGHGPDACANGRETGTRAWTDYPHRCLPGDRTAPYCEMRDAATGLGFILPENRVAEVVPASGADIFPRAAFIDATGATASIFLNPETPPPGDNACHITRVGRLCADPDRGDEKLAAAIRTLQFTLTTGQVIRRCGDTACAFDHPNPPISGQLPARWSVEAARPTGDGGRQLSTWFFDLDRSGAFHLIGLNQPGGTDCREAGPGNRLCAFTPGIASQDFDLIRRTLGTGGTRGDTDGNTGGDTGGGASDAARTLELLAPSRTPAR